MILEVLFEKSIIEITQSSCHMPLKVRGLDKDLWCGLPNVAVV